MTTSTDAASLGGLFAPYEVDIRQPRVVDLIAARMRHTGLVAVRGLTSPEAVATFADRVMHRGVYPGEGPLGLHEVWDTGEHAHLVGHTELTRAAVDVHTRRADLVLPPRLVLMACIHPAHEGGETVLVDGKVLFGDLCRRRPDTAHAFLYERAAAFGRTVAAPVFEDVGRRRYVLRLRQDGVVRWSAATQPFLPVLRTALQRHQQVLALGYGQGVLVDNARWATGRLAFTGPRAFLRAEGTARIRMASGFVSGAVPR
ncbi:TauD/TfdA family dioxygenase [Streptomyces olivoreticuli]|uniref:TauD/TfdA family dioxygenase n=1 Tax=Streptomyces olivoreticuli TaxID=68246 RepID=UPI0013C36408|nr:TauD/TfdA family dioxygenase [Streptomyces olivoreticuli]